MSPDGFGEQDPPKTSVNVAHDPGIAAARPGRAGGKGHGEPATSPRPPLRSVSAAHHLDSNPNQYILQCMKTITLNVSEPVYADFQRYAQEQDRPTSELLREAMELYRQSRIRPARSLRDLKPSSIGAILQPWSSRSELLEDFLELHDPRD